MTNRMREGKGKKGHTKENGREKKKQDGASGRPYFSGR